MGYEAALQLEQEVAEQWWWNKIWKILGPLKTILNLWLAMSNKSLTWEVLLKRGFHGPIIFLLCRYENETNSHLFSSCTYAGTVWEKTIRKLDPSLNPSEDTSLEHRFKNW